MELLYTVPNVVQTYGGPSRWGVIKTACWPCQYVAGPYRYDREGKPYPEQNDYPNRFIADLDEAIAWANTSAENAIANDRAQRS